MRLHNSRRHSVLAALLLTTTFAGCSGSAFTAQGRRLASVDLLVPRALPRPVPKAGDDLMLVAKRYRDYGDENALRLMIARCNVDDQATQLASSGRTKRSALPACVTLRKDQEK